MEDHWAKCGSQLLGNKLASALADRGINHFLKTCKQSSLSDQGLEKRGLCSSKNTPREDSRIFTWWRIHSIHNEQTRFPNLTWKEILEPLRSMVLGQQQAGTPRKKFSPLKVTPTPTLFSLLKVPWQHSTERKELTRSSSPTPRFQLWTPAKSKFQCLASCLH